jgi:hypothetical protein
LLDLRRPRQLSSPGGAVLPLVLLFAPDSFESLLLQVIEALLEFIVRARGGTRAQGRRRGRAAFAFRAVRQRSGLSQEPTQEIAEETHGKTSLADHAQRLLRIRFERAEISDLDHGAEFVNAFDGPL